MGTGQMLLTICAMVLMGSIILSTNRNINTNSYTLLRTNCGLDAVSLATSIIQEADSCAFDSSTVSGSDTVLTQLTPVASLGRDNNNPNDLDDVDDYNGLTGQDSMGSGWYYWKTKVFYVNNPANLNQNSTIARSWTKRLDIWVWNKDLPDTIVMHSIYSYWFFGRAGRP